MNALLIASYFGFSKFVKYLLKHSEVPLNHKDKGRAAIHFAALIGNRKIIQYLVKKGCDTKLKCKHEKSNDFYLASNFKTENEIDFKEILSKKGYSWSGSFIRIMSYIQRLNKRVNKFKQRIDYVEARGKRHKQTIQISKMKKEENMMKRRNLEITSDQKNLTDSGVFEDLANFVQMIESKKPDEAILGLRLIRKLILQQKDVPIQQVIDIGLIPNFIYYLNHEEAEFQFESAWILTNLLSGTKEQTKIILDFECIPRFVELLFFKNENVRNQSIWAIGNIAGDSAGYRDQLLDLNVIPKMIQLFQKCSSIEVKRTILWALSNLCRGQPKPQFSKIQQILPILKEVLESNDLPSLTYTGVALSYLTSGTNEEIQICMSYDIVPYLMKLLGTSDFKLLISVLRTIGNIISGTEEQTNFIIQQNILPILNNLIENSNNIIRKEVCWMISNITAGSKEQIQQVFNTENLFNKLLTILEKDSFDVVQEAIWAVSNSITGGSFEQISWTISQGSLKPIVNLLDFDDSTIVNVCLDAIETILESGDQSLETHNLFLEEFENLGGKQLINKLVQSEDPSIFKKSSQILYLYLILDETIDQMINDNGGGNQEDNCQIDENVFHI
ncbi:importin subunit alpha-4 [Anaeramoeba ignava]|uniref:Importin subunit alpha-4 n=1 Tax=Anaeramoeba ignava TaxID=1746090 RepID=A0A9Q0R9A0_ANAIG|nr:importin subunit alpha-4 [Anaeramoeba ignava]